MIGSGLYWVTCDSGKALVERKRGISRRSGKRTGAFDVLPIFVFFGAVNN